MTEHTAPAGPDLAKRRRVGRALVLFAAGLAMFTSGWGMWTFFSHILGADRWYLILPMFLFIDASAVACAWNARINRLSYNSMGLEGWLVWGFAALSALMSASDASSRDEAAARFFAPVVTAILFELLIRGERKDAEGVTDGPLDRLKRRALARLGLLDSIGQSDEDAAKRAAAGRLATLAYRMHRLEADTRARRRAEARFHRKLRSTTERLHIASDDRTIVMVRDHLAALYQSISGTSREAVADRNAWQAANWPSAANTPVAVDLEAVAPLPEVVAPEPAELVALPQVPVAVDRAEVVAPHLSGLTNGISVHDLSTPDLFARRTDEQPGPVGQVFAADRVPSGQISVRVPDSRKRSDEQILSDHGEQLTKMLAEAGKLSRYQVEQTCGVSARQAGRVLDTIKERAASAE